MRRVLAPLVKTPLATGATRPRVPLVPYYLDCPDLGQSVTVIGEDPHGFDRNRDGQGCENNERSSGRYGIYSGRLVPLTKRT